MRNLAILSLLLTLAFAAGSPADEAMVHYVAPTDRESVTVSSAPTMTASDFYAAHASGTNEHFESTDGLQAPETDGSTEGTANPMAAFDKYPPPAFEFAPDMDVSGLLGRLVLGLVLATSLFFALILFTRFTNARKRNASRWGEMEVLDTVYVAPRCCLHLVSVQDQLVLVGRDASGMREIVPIRAGFDASLEASLDTEEETGLSSDSDKNAIRRAAANVARPAGIRNRAMNLEEASAHGWQLDKKNSAAKPLGASAGWT